MREKRGEEKKEKEGRRGEELKGEEGVGGMGEETGKEMLACVCEY